MDRQYEDPRKLQEQLNSELKRCNEPGYVMSESDHEQIEDLRERVNFAWQDEEYDLNCGNI